MNTKNFIAQKWPEPQGAGDRMTLTLLAEILGLEETGMSDMSNAAIVAAVRTLVLERDALRVKNEMLLEELETETSDGR